MRRLIMEISDVYKKYKDNINMSYSEFYSWIKDPESQTASVDVSRETPRIKQERRRLLYYAASQNIKVPTPVKTSQLRNLVLLKTPKKDWDNFLSSQALKSISYLSRAKKIKGKDLKKNKIALKNWAYKS